MYMFFIAVDYILFLLGKGQVCPEGINNHTFVLGFFLAPQLKNMSQMCACAYKRQSRLQ